MARRAESEGGGQGGGQGGWWGSSRISRRRGLGYESLGDRAERSDESYSGQDNPPRQQEERLQPSPIRRSNRREENPRNQDEPSVGRGMERAMGILRDIMTEARQQRPQALPLAPLGTPMLPIVTAMKNLKTPYFEGSTDPIEADQWIRKLEKNLDTAMCPQELRKRIATYYLDKDAADWWDSCERQLGQNDSWTVFKTEFEKKYFPPEARLRLQRQFMNLKQGNRSIREFESEFMRLRRHALPGQEDERSMITNFMYGVQPEFESRLAVGTYNSLTELIEKAVNVENGLNAEKAARKGSHQNPAAKNASSSGFMKDKGKEKESEEQSEGFKFSGKCYKCGRRGHKSYECPSKDGSQQGSNQVVCYSCGQQGHISTRCSANRSFPAAPFATRPPQAPLAIEPAPKRLAVEGRVYALELDDSRPAGPA